MKGLKCYWDKLLRLLVLCCLCCISSGAYCQIGCTRSNIEDADVIFAECAVFDSCLVCTAIDGSLFVFNINEHDICTSMTAYIDYNTDSYLEVIKRFNCNHPFSSSLKYDHEASLTIFTMR